jgi:hypothetical protein
VISYNQVDVLFLDVRVGLGWFSRLVREDDAKTVVEFAFRVGIAIRILQHTRSTRPNRLLFMTHVDYDLGFWMSVVAATL